MTPGEQVRYRPLGKSRMERGTVRAVGVRHLTVWNARRGCVTVPIERVEENKR